MDKILGIRREDKNQWEKRAPLIPDDIKGLKETFGIKTIVQPSDQRIFSDEAYKKAGATIDEDLSSANVIFGVKEIPEEMFERGKTYVFFSHTIKGQSYNMKMLKRLIDLECNLIDYERIVDENSVRLIFFGRHAGLAGMIETFFCFGKKMRLLGYPNPFERIKQAYRYHSLDEAKLEIGRIGKEIEQNGFPIEVTPLIVGFAGYGNVSNGAQEIFDLLPHKVISANILEDMYENFINDNFSLYKVIFKEEDIVKSKAGDFELQDYYDFPEKYESRFEDYIPSLQLLVNCIYWSEKYPRLITREYLKDSAKLRSDMNLKVIGDISCDINGSIEITHKATLPDNPTFTYLAEKDGFEDGTLASGVTVMAVDNLTCEFSREASVEFSSVLKKFAKDILKTNYNQGFEQLELPYPIKKGLILHNGEFTDEYKYMSQYLK